MLTAPWPPHRDVQLTTRALSGTFPLKHDRGPIILCKSATHEVVRPCAPRRDPTKRANREREKRALINSAAAKTKFQHFLMRLSHVRRLCRASRVVPPCAKKKLSAKHCAPLWADQCELFPLAAEFPRSGHVWA